MRTRLMRLSQMHCMMPSNCMICGQPAPDYIVEESKKRVREVGEDAIGYLVCLACEEMVLYSQGLTDLQRIQLARDAWLN